MSGTTAVDVRHWYRRLYRSGLRAVMYSTPARFVVRDQMRAAFRGKGKVLDEEVAKRTNWFLTWAAAERGLEHKIIKNLVFVAHSRKKEHSFRIKYQKDSKKQYKSLFHEAKAMSDTAYNQFDMTVAMLNKSMGLGLRCRPTYRPT